MVLSADKERLKSLLKETITLLCRNGLAFKSKFSIEALIGVTLDEDDIFLISINELIQTELNSTLDDSQICNDEASDGSSISDGSTALVERHRSRKRRHPQHASIKMEPLFSEVGDQSQNDDQEQDGDGDGGNGDGTGGGGDGASDDQSSAKKPHTDNNDDGGQDNGDNHDEDSKDIVFIKQEIDTWSNDVPSTAQSSTSYQGTSGSQGNMNFSLSDMNLVPISSRDEGGMMWQSNTQQPLSYLHQSSTTLTSSVQQPGDMQLAGQQPQQMSGGRAGAGGGGGYRCSVCSRLCQSRSVLRKHENWHANIYPYRCSYCGKGCMSTSAARPPGRSHRPQGVQVRALLQGVSLQVRPEGAPAGRARHRGASSSRWQELIAADGRSWDMGDNSRLAHVGHGRQQ